MAFDVQRKLGSPTGATLNLHVREATGTPRGVIQVNHGLAEHSARYARFAGAMAERGFTTYAHDHRGHGATKAPDAPPGVFAAENAYAKVIADVEAVHDAIALEHPGQPVIVFGHSMGGMIALNFVLRHSARVSAAAIWNASFSAGMLGRLATALLAWERFRLGSDVPSRIIPRLTFGAFSRKETDNRTAFDWLSRDPAEVDSYVADPLCGWDASVGMWRTVFEFIFEGADNTNFSAIRRDLPFNLVGGARDPATDGGRAVDALSARLSAMGFGDVRTTIYEATRHESLNEVNRDAITADFAAWVEKLGW